MTKTAGRPLALPAVRGQSVMCRTGKPYVEAAPQLTLAKPTPKAKPGKKNRKSSQSNPLGTSNGTDGKRKAEEAELTPQVEYNTDKRIHVAYCTMPKKSMATAGD